MSSGTAVDTNVLVEQFGSLFYVCYFFDVPYCGKIVQSIHRSGYHGDERDSCGVTPLMDAARANHIEAAQFLISEYEVCIAVR